MVVLKHIMHISPTGLHDQIVDVHIGRPYARYSTAALAVYQSTGTLIYDPNDTLCHARTLLSYYVPFPT
jgi:hypothetical protein